MSTGKPIKIKHKLVLLILAITLFTMLVSIGFLFFRDLAQFRRDSLNSIQTIANITAINTVAEVVFADKEEAVRSLSQLKYLDDFVFAALFDKDKRMLAGFPDKQASDMGKSHGQLSQETDKKDGFFRVMRPVTYKDELVGFIFLKFSSQSFQEKVRDYLVDIAFFSVILLVIVLVLTLKAQGIVSRPIVVLTDFVKRISAQRDYSLRIRKKSSDEIGLLYDGFNTMLSVIEEHQGELKRYHEHLEELVEERTRALSQMNAEMTKLIKAVEYSPNIVTILDHEGRVQYVNPKFEELTGFDRSEVEGQLASFLNRRYHDESSYQKMHEALKKGDDWNGEILNTRKDGSEYWEKISLSCVRDKNGAISHYIEVAEDNSARKAAEAYLRKAKEMAERANRLKSEFLANMSHEIRTPMNAILGYAKLLLEGERDETRRRQLEIINISGENLLVIINDVLDFSKIEANKLELVHRSFSIQEMLDHLERMFSIKAEEKQLYMKMHVDTPLPECLYGDRSRLQQILINIIGNAIKFTRKGGVTVAVSYRDSGHLFISVRDTGVGIPASFQKFIFEPFTQADGSTTREFGGTGLGLTIAYNLLRLMGGEMELESREGTGTTFRLQIPINPCREGGGSVERYRARRDSSLWGQRHIILIDEKEGDSQLWMDFWQGNGFGVSRHDPEGKIRPGTEEEEAGLILFNMGLQKPDFFSLHEQLKRNDARQNQPIVVFAGGDGDDDTVHFAALHYLKKPVQDDDLPAFRESFLPYKRDFRHLFIVDDDLDWLKRYGDVFRDHPFSIFSFSGISDAVHEIREGIVPDLLIVSLSALESAGSSLFDELLSQDSPLPVLFLVLAELSGKEMVRSSEKIRELLMKTRQTKRDLRDFVDRFFNDQAEDGQKMVARWLSRCNGDSELEQIVLSGLQSLPYAVQKLAESIANGDINQIRFNAHSLKGMATNLFMEEVGQITRQIDQAVKSEPVSLSHIRILLAKLEAVVQMIPEDYGGDNVKKNQKNQEKIKAGGVGILIAEDDPINQQLMQDYFGFRGLDVDMAENGQVVLDRLTEGHYDILLLDMQMPVMDGMETISRIRADNRYRHLHVIALTGHAMRGDREKYLEAGCNDYLSKPVNFNELQHKIDQLIAKREG